MKLVEMLRSVKAQTGGTFVGILVFGDIGGYISTHLPSVDPIVSSIPHSIFLGAVAAFLFVILASNTDRSDTLRLLAISMLAGMAWQSVLVGLRDSRRLASAHQRVEVAEQRAEVAEDGLQLVANGAELVQLLNSREQEDHVESLDAMLARTKESAGNLNSEDAKNVLSTMLAAELKDHKDPELAQRIIGELDDVGIQVR